MDESNLTLETDERQDFHSAVDAIPLARANRRLLLGASLRLLGHRFISGKPIFQADVLRVASLADDAVERAA
jgi:hypothetical protein